MKPGSPPLKKVSKDPCKRKRAPSGGGQPSAGSASKLTADLPMNTRAIQMVKTPHTVVNHSYVDYSLVPPTSEDNQQKPKPINEMDFHEKLHSMLGRIEFQDSIGWLPHGRAFRVTIPSRFENTVCPEYFGHKRYSSFLYKLGVHGYKQISAGTDRGAYYSPLLLRGLPHLTKYTPNPKEFRHLIQDPLSEPDFYLIRFIAPLPDDDHFGRTITLEDVLQFCRENGRSEKLVIDQLQVFISKG